MEHRFLLKLSVIVLIAVSMLIMALNYLNTTYIDIHVGDHIIKDFRYIRITGPGKRNAFYINDNRTVEDIIYAFNTAKYEKSSVKELNSMDCSVSFISKAKGDVSWSTDIVISKETIQIGRDFYKCDAELYSRVMDVYNRHKTAQQIKSLSVNLPEGIKEVEYIIDGRSSYEPAAGSIDLYNASSSELEKASLARYKKEFAPVKDEADAVRAASLLICDIKKDCLEHEMPFEIKYNENAKAWIIHGTLPSGYAGGVISIAINENGKVLLLMHTK